MRLSTGSVGALASNWLLFVVRACVAFLLALPILATRPLHLAGMAGILGLYAVTDGVIAGIAWLHERRCRAFGLEAVTGIVLGFAMFFASHDARALLTVVALRALSFAALEAQYLRRTLAPRDARVSLIAAIVCAAIGLGFLIARAFGYGALDLYACIAGYQLALSVVLFSYGQRLHGVHPRLPHWLARR